MRPHAQPWTALALSLGLAETLRADAIDDFVRSEMRRQRIPGLSVAVVRRGEPARVQGYGLASVELDVPAGGQTVYQTGSMGKQFTAAAVLLLVQDGRLGLDDPVSKYFPDAPGHWQGITVRHLLTHTGGVPDYGPPGVEFRRDYTEDQLRTIIMAPPLSFAPGTKWTYSNAGYVVLGALIGRITGGHWSELLARRVFAPLGMASARLISEADIVPQRAAGYRIEGGALQNQEWVAPSLNTTADGALYMSVADLVRWDAALDGEGLLRAENRRLLWEPVRLANGWHAPYGFGWFVTDRRGHPVIEHSGHWQGFSAHIVRYPEDELTVIVMCNLAFAEVRALAHGIASRARPALALPAAEGAGADPVSGREARFREALAAWAGSQPLPHMAEGVMAPSLPPPGEAISRQRTAERLQQMTGFGWLATDDVRRRRLERNGSAIVDIVHYVMRTPAGAYLYDCYLDARGRIADFVPEEW